MCGIAGYSLSPESSVERTLAAQALLAGIAERGADAVGYAHRGSSPSVTVHKRRSGASALLDEVHVPSASTQLLVHVRDYTKGHPTIEANNHPIRHGSVVGIHNGIIVNDEEIFARYGFERAHPDMTVDSEAIFALAEHAEGSPEALEELRGAMATAWLDERIGSVLFLARARRPAAVDRHRRPRALLRLDARRPRAARADAPPEPAQARGRRGDAAADRERPHHRHRPLQARPLLRRGDDSPVGARAPRGRIVPAAARRDHARNPPDLDPLGQPTLPSAATSAPSSRSRSRTRNWNAAHAGWTSIIR